jgi:flagellum-specific ATP synthase
MAVKQVPPIYEVLKQTPGERPARDAFADMATALRNANNQQAQATPNIVRQR